MEFVHWLHIVLGHREPTPTTVIQNYFILKLYVLDLYTSRSIRLFEDLFLVVPSLDYVT
jgi:hypothetical protein